MDGNREIVGKLGQGNGRSGRWWLVVKSEWNLKPLDFLRATVGLEQGIGRHCGHFALPQ